MLTKKMESLSLCCTEQRHRALYKSRESSISPQWKETYRKGCLDRWKQSRGKLVDQFRRLGDEVSPSSNQESTDRISSLVEDELRSMTKCSDGDHVDEYLAVMDDIKKELLLEEEAFLRQYREATEAIPAEIDLADNYKSGYVRILCPFCQRNWLNGCDYVISCACGIEIVTRHDPLGWDSYHNNMTIGLELHSRVCEHDPIFIIGYCDYYEADTLTIRCKSCIFSFPVIYYSE